MTNPLLASWDTPFGIAPFDQISDEDFAPALDAALAAHKAQIDAIAESSEAPTFATVIEALEAPCVPLEQVLSVFYSVAGADSNDAREALQREFSPKLAAHFSAITANKALYGKVKAVWDARDSLDLTDEQARVLMLTHRGFVRGGAALEGAADARMQEIKSRLATLGTEFTQNLLADERTWFMALSEDDLEGLPDFVVSSARTAGKEKGADGPVVTLARSLVTPFLQFSPRRDLRQKAHEAWAARGANGGETDNRAIAAEILALREERAKLLGYENFAAYKLETEMAGTPEAVRDLLMQVWTPAKAQADRDAGILAAMMHEDGINGDLQPWDWHYYSEKRRKVEHDLDEAELKPYLQLDQMIEASFACANRLFGLEFAPLDVPLYHADCRAWEVTRGGEHVAVFIGDYFARGSKRSGAWCSAMRAQAKFPKRQTPVVINVCNFAKGDPALLSWDDARTLFHEFGHALHQMLSNVTYESVSGTSVARDFVELPSQLYEHWLEVPEVLEEFALHSDTGAPMPADMLKKVLGAATYDMGFATVEYVASALVDLAFHDGPAPKDPMAKQAEVLSQIAMPSAIIMRHATPHFAHVFAGDGYSSGYYSYMWSEVMDADAFAAFEEAGSAFDAGRAKALEDHILSKGGSVDAADLYTAFRGRLPGVEALLKGRGLAAE
ncbi:Peptidyl-dipeptidase dcp [Tritonibacter multivorans]|uniref:Peptidyl-dipeptidase dcp n=1 Tax=Tritonibacter multivorans TaxID=928856 RepID=A0A0P1GNS3_9RHOB|nr:M3 family metallopeptidase [Tritonibacter multivorans]MDA7422782.1 M3 family metallopeptidase [Tritonibacter multivorans]CUH77357.1 Peptidyl-dipeptidase dcp [Tritonibacter multivorans]SFD60061.1 peptidyl-dipeptidase Dcp Metallo peptidase. MEROPS family M03A [Tritonibacter multivorans]